jgi:hypothetical protein
MLAGMPVSVAVEVVTRRHGGVEGCGSPSGRAATGLRRTAADGRPSGGRILPTGP